MASTSELSEEFYEDNPYEEIEQAEGIAVAPYTLIGWAIDTTGRKLIDEICQIAAFTQNSTFSQYILPYGHVCPAFVRKHALRVVTVAKYRMLKDLERNQYIQTKTEASALRAFMEWLEDQKVAGTKGILLMYHEMWKTSPGMLLEALNRHDMLDRFKGVVKGFVNSYEVSKNSCSLTTKFFTIRVMAKVLLNDEDRNFSSAKDRAQVIYRIIIHLSDGVRESLDDESMRNRTGREPHVMDFICPFANTVDVEESNLSRLKEVIRIQNTFRPIFNHLLRGTRKDRRRGNHLRQLLAENNVDYNKMEEAYNAGKKEGLDVLLNSEIRGAREQDLENLSHIINDYFESKAVRVEEPKRSKKPKKFYRIFRRTVIPENRSELSSSSNDPITPPPPVENEEWWD